MGKRSILDREDAERIAKKLDAEIKPGRDHARAIVRLNDQYVGAFGIRRGKKSLGHDFVMDHIGATTREAIDLSRCPLDKAGFIAKLVERGGLEPR